MCTGGIHWCSFSWDAFATLATGILAVGAAFVVGRAQVRLLERQTDIQEMTLRQELFDRRFRVLEKTEAFIGAILREADQPSHEVQRDFLTAIGEARFLFSDSVRAGLDDIWREATAFFALKRTMDALFRRERHYGQGNPEKESEALKKLAERFRGLPELFGEMKPSW